MSKLIDKAVLLCAFTASVAFAQQPYLGYGGNASGWGWFGTKTAFAGYSSWYEFFPRWGSPVTCNPATSRCDTNGAYIPDGREGTVYFASDGRPPAGIYTIYGSMFATYGICDIQGTSFTLRQANCSGPVQHFTDAGEGVHYVLFKLPKNIYITDDSGFPEGAVLKWWVNDYGGIRGLAGNTANGHPYDHLTEQFLSLQVEIPADTEPGDYDVSVTVSEDDDGNNSTTLKWTITVNKLEPIATSFDPTYASNYTPIPGLDSWVSQMVSSDGGGSQWCSNRNHPSEQFGFGAENQVWYYDGAYIYFQIADYTGDRSWENCAMNVATQYRDYILQNDGSVPGWRVFPYGLAKATLSGDARFRAALLALKQHGFLLYGGRITDLVIREDSYALDYFVTMERDLGEERDPVMQRTAEFIMGQLLSYSEGTGHYSQYQTFMVGLAMEALINYWDLTKDPRVPFVIKQTLDDIWSRYDQNTHVIMYNPDPPGPKCSAVPLWFQPDTGGNCGLNYGQLLNDLVTMPFAWYWRLSGDDTYKRRGDDLFSHALDEGPVFSGKAFSQMYRSSIDYVRFRGGF